MQQRTVALITVGSLILCSTTCVKYRKEKVFNEILKVIGVGGEGGSDAVPTVSEWGLIIMALLSLTAGTIVFARRRRPAAA